MALLSGTTAAAIQELTLARLVAAGTSAGTRVTVGRQEPYAGGAGLPAIDLSVQRQSMRLQLAGQTGLCTPVWDAAYSVVIAGRASGATDALTDAAIRTLTEQIVDALAGDVAYLDALPGPLTGIDTQTFVAVDDAADGIAGVVVTLTVEGDRVQYG